MGGRIEPAEPEPPPAHSIGRVGEDAMGRSGQFVQPCWLGAGGVALVVRNRWRGWWSALPGLVFLARCALNFVPFSDIFGQLCAAKHGKINRKPEEHIFQQM